MIGFQVDIDDLRRTSSRLRTVVDALDETDQSTKHLRLETGRPESTTVAGHAVEAFHSEIQVIRNSLRGIAERAALSAEAYQDVDAQVGARLGRQP